MERLSDPLRVYSRQQSVGLAEKVGTLSTEKKKPGGDWRGKMMIFPIFSVNDVVGLMQLSNRSKLLH